MRLRRAAELEPGSVVSSIPAWEDHLRVTSDIPEVTVADLVWADGYVFGSPTRFGNLASQLRQFLDTTGVAWAAGDLADKPVSGFTCTGSVHGGQESALLSMYQTFMHWGALIVPMGYTDPVIEEAGGNPYGVSSLDDGTGPTEAVLAAARFQGRRVTEFASALERGRQPIPVGGAGMSDPLKSL